MNTIYNFCKCCDNSQKCYKDNHIAVFLAASFFMPILKITILLGIYMINFIFHGFYLKFLWVHESVSRSWNEYTESVATVTYFQIIDTISQALVKGLCSTTVGWCVQYRLYGFVVLVYVLQDNVSGFEVRDETFFPISPKVNPMRTVLCTVLSGQLKHVYSFDLRVRILWWCYQLACVGDPPLSVLVL